MLGPGPHCFDGLVGNEIVLVHLLHRLNYRHSMEGRLADGARAVLDEDVSIVVDLQFFGDSAPVFQTVPELALHSVPEGVARLLVLLLKLRDSKFSTVEALPLGEHRVVQRAHLLLVDDAKLVIAHRRIIALWWRRGQWQRFSEYPR